MAKPITAKSIKSKVVKQMKDLGTYRKEFEMIIDIFAGMLYQYQKLAQDYADMGYPVTDTYVNKAGAENERKVPILTALHQRCASISDLPLMKLAVTSFTSRP